MSMRYQAAIIKPGFNPLGTSGVQYSGLWTRAQQMQAVAARNWIGPTLFAWGNNNFGQLGLGNRTNYSSPKQIGSLTNWSNCVSTQSTTAAIKTDGTLWTWGGNLSGILGLGNTTWYSSPKQVGALTNWKSVSGFSGILALKTDGTMWGWGSNQSGIFPNNYSSPKQVGSATNWTFVSTIQNSAFAIAS